jgi:hypothetical protein
MVIFLKPLLKFREFGFGIEADSHSRFHVVGEVVGVQPETPGTPEEPTRVVGPEKSIPV